MSSQLARLHQRILQKTQDQIALKARLARCGQRMEAIVRQFIELGNKWEIEGLDPIDDAPIPFVVLMFDQLARWFKRAEWSALALGTIAAAGLSIVTFEGQAMNVFIIASAIAILISGVLVGVMLLTTNVNWKNPAARTSLNAWGVVFGIGMAIGLSSILYLRFVSNATAIGWMATWLTVFETSVLGLTAVFHATAALYQWSRKLSEDYETLEAERQDLDQRLAVATVDLSSMASNSDGLEAQVESVHATARAATAS